MPRVSVVICCANAADTLPAACASAAWADELLIVDSGSTDATAQIAQAHADRYLVEPWRGYSAQKKFAAEQAAHDWVLVLDADEEISADLAAAIRALDDAALEKIDVGYMRRKHYLMGRYVRAWSPDWQSRFIHRGRVKWSDDALHENRLPSDKSRTLRLPGHLEHKRTSAAGFGDYFSGRRMDERLIMVAEQMHQRGKRATWIDFAFRPAAAFLKSYVFKFGLLDGAFGLMVAQKAAASTQLKYAALWAVQQQRQNSD